MTVVNGSLAKRVMNILTTEGAVVAGMVIDEQAGRHAATLVQKNMLKNLANWYCPVIFVEQNPQWRLPPAPNRAPRATRRTILELRSAAGDLPRRVIKGYFNAMVQTDLDEKLAADNISYVVLMGQQTNCCVRSTAIGGADIDHAAYPGLVDHGIRVLTSPWLLHSVPPNADFRDHDMVEMYSWL